MAAPLAGVNFFTGGFGPSQPLLRADQGTSLTVAGLHGTALGVAAIIAGLLNPHLVHKFGRRNTIWLAVTVFSCGVVMFALLPPVQLTILAALIAGFGISAVINNANSEMSEDAGAQRNDALAQLNAIAILGFVLGNVTVGTIATLARSQWRLGLLILPIFMLILFVARNKDLEKHVPHSDGPQRGKLSLLFWISTFGFFLSIATEFATSFWAAALVADRVGSTAALSTLAVATVGTAIGFTRWFSSSIFRSDNPDVRLKRALIIHFFAFWILWSSHSFPLSIIALALTGVGISIQFPLYTIRTIGFSEGRPDLAIGHSSRAAGIAIALSPFMLGVLGDAFGISQAFLMVPVLITLSLICVIATPQKEGAFH